MNKDYAELIDESIKLELQISDLYLVFHESFSEDADFWWELSVEEKNHAALLKSLKGVSEQFKDFPHSIFFPGLRDLKIANSKIKVLIGECGKSPPSREEALNIAFEIEHSAGELHYQRFMDEHHDQAISEIFKQLNGDDKDHALKIKSYMDNNGFKFKSVTK